MSILSEKRTVEKMIRLYCSLNHKQKKLCPECLTLLEYARSRLDLCPFGNQKPMCRRCSIHCYEKQQREKIKQVMRFSGPRILFYEPFTFLKHLLK
ncbi:MAG: nitrous oxide-stimulated promoter family protein [Paludibacteraceae bacterium]|nr:nitrous oxide-stimulated promoter family protein [Paludibacteraceae bacterium]